MCEELSGNGNGAPTVARAARIDCLRRRDDCDSAIAYGCCLGACVLSARVW